MIKNKKAIIKELVTQAQNKDWDDLAHEIILLEMGIGFEKDPKYLILLKMKLKVWEAEKTSRVFNSFDMQFFLNKDLEEFDVNFI